MACTSQNLSRRFRFYSLYFPELSTLIWRGDLIHHCYKKPWIAIKKRYESELYFQIVIFSIFLLWQIACVYLANTKIAKEIYKKYFISILLMSLAKAYKLPAYKWVKYQASYMNTFEKTIVLQNKSQKILKSFVVSKISWELSSVESSSLDFWSRMSKVSYITSTKGLTLNGFYALIWNHYQEQHYKSCLK